MTLQDIQRWASQGEGLTVEFKKKAAHPDKIVRELIAFANTAGGVLLLGVDDDGTVSGQRFIEEEVFVMEKAIKEHVFPLLEYEVALFKLNEKRGVAVFSVSRSDQRPHYILEGNRKRAFIRVADRTVQASKEVWEILRKGKFQKDIVFTYGKKETILMQALEEHETLTLKQYASLAKLPRFLASKTLIRLVLANVLEIIPQEIEDRYQLKESL
ncbi:ATP-binding protein [Belliella sp. DSM 111904]|uniref:ATP-binding protein n=1 Tax=Belliella filtrata TaxID=2923435 RepID=A0ABS9V048_9BACT|nr:ATP-binding protein [Belliella filtrata]MCH7409729.1 ATP-binding protein [Belliella filtrata]